MKLKYKKAILLTMMSTMGIGLLTMSLSSDKSNAQETDSDTIGQPAMSMATDADEHDGSQNRPSNVATSEEVTPPTATPTAAPTPTLTPLTKPVYPIEENSYPKITELITSYYNALNKRDVDTLKKLVNDPSAVYTLEELKQIMAYYDDYRNIKVYVKKSYIDGTYIVYVYYEVKIINIKTSAPSLSKYYVVTDTNGDLKIFFGAIMDEEIKTYYDTRDTDEDVMDLINMTNDKFYEAKANDKDLKTFCDKLDQLANNGDTANN